MPPKPETIDLPTWRQPEPSTNVHCESCQTIFAARPGLNLFPVCKFRRQNPIGAKRSQAVKIAQDMMNAETQQWSRRSNKRNQGLIWRPWMLCCVERYPLGQTIIKNNSKRGDLMSDPCPYRGEQLNFVVIVSPGLYCSGNMWKDF